MRSLTLALAILAVSAVAPARADDRPVTGEERAQLVAAMQAEGCSGGEMEFDDGKFEVDDARCDGKKYDLDFDRSFKLIKKDQDD